MIDNRRYRIESVGEIIGDVSMRDITFQNHVGFPINRVEKISYIRRLLEQPQPELSSEEHTDKSAVPSSDRHNYRITEDTLGVGGAKEKFRNNMAAIHLLHELELEHRLATPEEQEVLARYVGWGGLSMAFDENNAAWAQEFKELNASLSPEEYRAAMESTLTAFYTPPVVIKAMYEALDHMGFSGGTILEPSCGTGNFFGLLPDRMAGSTLHGVEIDSLTGRIAKQLYQKASIAIEGFEQTKLPDDHFDVVVGNVPFGDFKVNDSRYNAQKFLIHDYFFAKALDKVRSGGVVAFITSKGTMDKTSPEVRKYIAQRAELLGAIRLPDNTFRANAGTEVTSDILFLQKRDRIADVEPGWVHLDTDENGITMNSYFVQHPEMILGEMKMESTRFGFDSVCKAYKDIPLADLLSKAVQNIHGEIPEYEKGIDEISDEPDASVPADPNVRNFSFTIVDGKVYFRENDRMTPATVSMTAESRIKGLIQILKYFPQTIKECEQRIVCYEADAFLARQHQPQGEEKFCPMTLKGITYTEKAVAGEMLLAVCKEYPMAEPAEIGSYRGFKLEVFYDTFNAHYCLYLCGKAKHKVDLGTDPLGNLTRIENELAKIPVKLEAAKTKKAETMEQLETAKIEVEKPFAFEDELKEKTERLNALNIELNLDQKDPAVLDAEPEQSEEPPERKCTSRER